MPGRWMQMKIEIRNTLDESHTLFLEELDEHYHSAKMTAFCRLARLTINYLNSRYLHPAQKVQ